MTPFQHLLHDHRLWGIRRRWVVPAFALGVFVAFLPFPGHTLIGALLALALRVNIPVAAMATWVSNPATMVLIYPFAYLFGCRLLGTEVQPFAFEATFEWLTTTFVNIWQPLLLGCLLLGAAAAVVAYGVLDAIWRYSLASYKWRKRDARGDSSSD